MGTPDSVGGEESGRGLRALQDASRDELVFRSAEPGSFLFTRTVQGIIHRFSVCGVFLLHRKPCRELGRVA